jgi:hypothetical protein
LFGCHDRNSLSFESGRYLSVCSAPVFILFYLHQCDAFPSFGLDVEQKIDMLAIRINNIDRMY